MPDTNSFNQIITNAAAKILRPLVRVMLRNGIPFDAFVDIAKKVYVELGMREFGIDGKKQTVSRVSILTGLSRKEVQRVVALPAPEEGAHSVENYHRAARVIAGWVRDKEFTDAHGEPNMLSMDSDAGSFSELVKRYSGDIPVRAMFDELLRVGAVERRECGRIRLLVRAYIPQTGDKDKINMLGTDVADLIQTIDHNLQHTMPATLLQRKVMYDNIPPEMMLLIRARSTAEGQHFLEDVDRWLSQYDRDVNPRINTDSNGTERVRAGIGIYYFEEKL